MKIASIDVGSNTVLMLIAKLDAKVKTLQTIENYHRIPRLSKGLTPDGNISEEKIQLLISILKEYSIELKKHNCDIVSAIGTNALRIAKNKHDIVNRVEKATGIKIEIIPGEREAELAFVGAAFSFDNKNKTVIDIGGGSTEIITGIDNQIVRKKSYQIGVVSLTERFMTDYKPDTRIIEKMFKYAESVFEDLPQAQDNEVCIAIGGTPVTLKCLSLEQNNYNISDIEGTLLSKNAINQTMKKLSELTLVEILQKYSPIVKGREDLLFAGAIILETILNKVGLNEVTITTKGIRYGNAVAYMLNLSDK